MIKEFLINAGDWHICTGAVNLKASVAADIIIINFTHNNIMLSQQELLQQVLLDLVNLNHPDRVLVYLHPGDSTVVDRAGQSICTVRSIPGAEIDPSLIPVLEFDDAPLPPAAAEHNRNVAERLDRKGQQNPTPANADVGADALLNDLRARLDTYATPAVAANTGAMINTTDIPAADAAANAVMESDNKAAVEQQQQQLVQQQ